MKLVAAVLIAVVLSAALVVALRPRPPPPLIPAAWCFVPAFGIAMLCRDLPLEREA